MTDAERLAKIEAAVAYYTNATPPIVGKLRREDYVFGPGVPAGIADVAWLLEQLKVANARSLALEAMLSEAREYIDPVSMIWLLPKIDEVLGD